jgi:hypothetical protein
MAVGRGLSVARALIALLALALVTALAASQPSWGFRGQKVFVATNADANNPSYRPKSFWLSGDPTLLATKVRWSSYNGSVARAHATGHANDCNPNCAGGSFKKGPIRLRLSGPKRACGRYFYSHVRITWVHRPPLGGPRSFRLDPSLFCQAG